MKPSEAENWFVVRTKPHQEARALQQLSNQGIEVFWPRITSTRRVSARSFSSLQPLFPGYMFVRFSLSDFRWHSINSTLGVLHLLSANERPLAVPDGLVESLIAATQTDGCIDIGSGLAPGQPVKLVAGPFAGLIGELAAIDRHQRAIILLQIMGQLIQVEIRARTLVPV